MFGSFIWLLVVVVAVNSERKCLPNQWEVAVFGKSAELNTLSGKVTSVVGSISTDYTNRRMIFRQTIYSDDGQVMQFDFLNTGAQMYIINVGASQCTTVPGETIEKPCTDSANTNLIASWYVGSEIMDLYVSSGKKASTVVARSSYTFVSSVMETSFMGGRQFTVYNYGNMTTGINDETVFNVPSFC